MRAARFRLRCRPSCAWPRGRACARLCPLGQLHSSELSRQARSQRDLGSPDRGRRHLLVPRRDRAVDPFLAAPDQASAAAAQCLRLLRHEQSQPGRGDDGCAAAHHLLQRPLSRDLRPGAVGSLGRHDRLRNPRAATQARGARRCLRRRVLREGGKPQRLDHRTAGRPGHPGEIFRAAERRLGGDASGRQRAAQAVAAARLDQAVPGNGAGQRAGLRGRQEHRGWPLHLRQQRL